MYCHNCYISQFFYSRAYPNPPNLFYVIDFLQKLGQLSFRMFLSMDFYVCFLLCHLSYSSIFYISCKLVNFKCLNKFNFFGIDSAVCFPWLHIWRYHFSDANIDEWVLNLFLGFFSNLTFCLFSLSSPASESCDHVLPGLPSMLHSISGWPAHPFT